MEKYSFGMFNPKMNLQSTLYDFFGKGIKSLIDVVATWPDYEHIVAKLKLLKVNFKHI